ncbi:hypothetical protein O1M54_13495 [Streptomyces diastatochromogenes]|nr:hypothetical protein [Streptomyces diastatochromogenes]
MGSPIGSGSVHRSTEDTRYRAANVVVSVGPYPFTTVRPGQASRTRRTAVGESTSPPAHTSATCVKHSGCCSAITAKSPAVSHSPVTARSATTRASSAVSGLPARATTAVPPPSSGTHSSYVDASKVCGEWTRTRRWAPAAQQASSTRSTTFRWVTSTPLGRPVEPEVYITYAVLCSPTPSASSGESGHRPRSSSARPSSTTTAGVRSASVNSMRSGG